MAGMSDDGNAWRMTACKQKPNMVIAMVTYPCFIQPREYEKKKTRLDHLEEEISPSWAVIQIRAANDKNIEALTCCGTAETLSHSAALAPLLLSGSSRACC